MFSISNQQVITKKNKMNLKTWIEKYSFLGEEIYPAKLPKKLKDSLRRVEEFKNCQLTFIEGPSMDITPEGKLIKIDKSRFKFSIDENSRDILTDNITSIKANLEIEPSKIEGVKMLQTDSVLLTPEIDLKGKIYLYAILLSPAQAYIKEKLQKEIVDTSIVKQIIIRLYAEDSKQYSETPIRKQGDCYVSIKNMQDNLEELQGKVPTYLPGTINKDSVFNSNDYQIRQEQQREKLKEQHEKFKEAIKKLKVKHLQFGLVNGYKTSSIVEVEKLLKKYEEFEQPVSFWQKLKGFIALWKGKETTLQFRRSLNSKLPEWLELEDAIDNKGVSPEDWANAINIGTENSLHKMRQEDMEDEQTTPVILKGVTEGKFEPNIKNLAEKIENEKRERRQKK